MNDLQDTTTIELHPYAVTLAHIAGLERRMVLYAINGTVALEMGYKALEAARSSLKYWAVTVQSAEKEETTA